MSFQVEVLRRTLFRLNDALGTEHTADFYVWLNKFKDFAGYRLIDHIEDIIQEGPNNPATKEILDTTEKLIIERIELFCKERNIDRVQTFLSAQAPS